jgi:tol-pal system protein YbgF
MAISLFDKKHFIRLGLFLAILVLSSCVTPEEKVYLNDQIVSLNSRVNRLETSDKGLSRDFDSGFQSLHQNQKKINSNLDSVRDRQAENVAEMGRIRTQMQMLIGRAEENSYLVKRTVERDTTEQDEIKIKLSELTELFEKLEAGIQHLNSYLGLESGSPDAKKGPAPPPLRERKTYKPPLPVVSKKPVSPDKRLYELTLKLHRDGKYEEAIEGFRNFLKKFPKSDLGDNAQFWTGESYMALKQYEQAILAYQNVIKKYPKGNKMLNAMLRQAQAFYELKDKTSSKILLKKIIKRYPKSREAKIAKKRLKKMR